MENFFYDHDEDDLPNIRDYVKTSQYSLNNQQQSPTNDDDLIERFNSNSSVHKWRSLLTTTIGLLDDDEDNRFDRPPSPPSPPRSTFQSYYLHEQPKVEQLPGSKTYVSSFFKPPENEEKSGRWSIEMPTLLDGTVGPDRQRRNLQRRHTTDIVLQLSNPNEISDRESISPLVRQMKDKFDRLAETASANNAENNPMNSAKENNPRQNRRQTSLTGRGAVHETSNWMLKRPISVLTRRDTNFPLNRSTSASSLAAVPSPNSSRTGPPVSYPKHFYPPAPTGVVIKQIMDNGATLIYDSSTRSRRSSESSNRVRRSSDSSARSKQQNSTYSKRAVVNEQRQNFTNSNSVLTGRQIPSTKGNHEYFRMKTSPNSTREIYRNASRASSDSENENYNGSNHSRRVH